MAPTKYKEFSQNARIFGDHLRDFRLLSSLLHYPPSLPVSPKRTHINPAPAGEGTRPSPLTSSHAVPFSSSTPQFKRPRSCPSGLPLPQSCEMSRHYGNGLIDAPSPFVTTNFLFFMTLV